MCKFHKDVAREIATNPTTNQFDAATYSVALAAMAKFRIEQYMPPMFGENGNSNYAMASARGVAALEQSGLKEKVTGQPVDLGFIRHTLARVMAAHGATMQTLNLTGKAKHDEAFLDEATVKIYENYTAPGYAAGALSVVKTAHKPEFEPLRAVVDDFLSQSGLEPVLRQGFETSVLRLFTAAPQRVNPVALKAYEKIPTHLRDVFSSCARCAGTGAGGALVSHLGCIALPVVAGATGSAVSGGLMTGMMFAGSPLIAAGVTYGLDKGRGRALSVPRIAGAAAIAFAVSLGINSLGEGHDHGSAPDHHNHHHSQVNPTPEALAWLNRLDPEARQKIKDQAEQSGLGLGIYLNGICAPTDGVKPQILSGPAY